MIPGASEYIKVPRRRLDSDRSNSSSLDQFEEMRPRSYTNPSSMETAEGLKDILPRHLRKPARLLNQVDGVDLLIICLFTNKPRTDCRS